MTANQNEHERLLESKIAEADARLETLEEQIVQIGQPAASELKRRYDALRIEENALKRNFTETQEGKGDHHKRMEQVESLLRHIEREESSVEHEAAFLNQGPPSTVVVAAEAGAKVIDAVGRGAKRIFGEKPFEKSSVFVNHSHETLVERYGLEKESGDSR